MQQPGNFERGDSCDGLSGQCGTVTQEGYAAASQRVRRANSAQLTASSHLPVHELQAWPCKRSKTKGG